MLERGSPIRLGGWLLFAALASACGGDPEIITDSSRDGSDSNGDDDGASDGDGNNNDSVDIDSGDDSGKDGGDDSGMPPEGDCGGVFCSVGQACQKKKCVDLECADLDCDADEICRPAPGGGHQCVDNSCESDVECELSQFCNAQGICESDSCEPGVFTCEDGQVAACDSNGGKATDLFTCSSAGYFTSECAGPDAAVSSCTCEDDWDCAEFTACEGGVCTGRGSEPTCSLPPTPFTQVLPELEFRWGGTGANHAATGRAFSFSSQVAATPLVINLDDDNGDGKIDEFDFPEILFMTYETDVANNGIIRAVHGGGPNKGQDYFALCGSVLWKEGDPLTNDCSPGTPESEDRNNARGRPAGTLAAGDLDGDGYPEIVVPLEGGRLQILSNTGSIITTYESDLRDTGPWNYPAPAIANMDHAGLSEIVVGNRVLTLKLNGTNIEFDRVFRGTGPNGTARSGSEQSHFGPSVCVADLSSTHAGLEFVAGTAAYRLPDVPANCTAPNDTTDYCMGRLTQLWNAKTVNPDAGVIDYENGFCAVADVWGADAGVSPGPANPLDQKPEAVVMADGKFLILDGATGTLIRKINLSGGTQGGAPNIDDFDGDGFPEIAGALADFYAVVDLQDPTTACPAWPTVLGDGQEPPGTNPARAAATSCETDADCTIEGTTCNETAGQCVCLHNGWKRDTEDDSSKVTSSSVFDFNGDGAAEVVYNDECYFRLYDGADGSVYLAKPSLSRTILENPVVADVDNDGNAEIIFVQNNETLQCSETSLDSWPNGNNDVPRASLPNGLEVWGDPSDVWVAARRIWNQHSYHVTNVLESGGLPRHEPESWKPLNGRLYNTFRSQPRNYGVAPDLALTAIQITSPDVACGQLSDTLQIVVEVRNLGDLRVGPGVVLDFEGTWASPSLTEALELPGGAPLQFTLTQSLEPGASTIVTVEYEAGSNGRSDLPRSIFAFIDRDNTERECGDDSNNEIEGAVDAGADVPDVRITLNNTPGCSNPKVQFTVYNDGSASVRDVLVRIYAGDPSSGGRALGDTTLAGPIAAGASANGSITLPSQGLDVRLWGVVDPLNTIAECNDGNNSDRGPLLNCNVVK